MFRFFQGLLLASGLILGTYFGITQALATHSEAGDVVQVGSYCKDLESFNILYEKAFSVGDKEEYKRIMMQDKSVKCYDMRAMRIPPVAITLKERLEDRPFYDGQELEIWRATLGYNVIYVWALIPSIST
jgi:hypothetical protein